LRGNPQFGAAMRHAARGAVELYRNDRFLNALMSDRARALFTHLALYLHYGRSRSGEPGLTVGAMKEMCIELRLCSRGRCEAMLALMRAAGLFAAVPDLDRRRRPLAPTEKLFALHRERWSTHFQAMHHVMPTAASHLAALEDPAFVRGFVIALCRRFTAGLRILDYASGLELFAERNGGMMILFSLALSGPEQGSFPSRTPVPLSINALAAKFSVSRKHVLTLLRDAETQGLVMRGGASNDEITVLLPGRNALEMLFATMFLYLAQCADEALAAMASSASSPKGLLAPASG
jgi:hypothetical protein